jgi:uncharacterized membrane protein
MSNRMKKLTIQLFALSIICMSLVSISKPAEARGKGGSSAGRSSSSSSRGHYSGGSGSSHKGGHYVSPYGNRYKK